MNSAIPCIFSTLNKNFLKFGITNNNFYKSIIDSFVKLNISMEFYPEESKKLINFYSNLSTYGIITIEDLKERM